MSSCQRSVAGRAELAASFLVLAFAWACPPDGKSWPCPIWAQAPTLFHQCSSKAAILRSIRSIRGSRDPFLRGTTLLHIRWSIYTSACRILRYRRSSSSYFHILADFAHYFLVISLSFVPSCSLPLVQDLLFITSSSSPQMARALESPHEFLQVFFTDSSIPKHHHNQRFRITEARAPKRPHRERESTPSLDESVLMLGSHHMKSERGFHFGSDPSKCDIFVGPRASGISAVHFRISFELKQESPTVMVVTNVTNKTQEHKSTIEG